MAKAGLRSGRRGGVLGPGEPAGLGDLRVGAAGDVARGCSSPATTRRWRAASLDIRRYIGERLGGRGVMRRDFEYIVLGLGGWGSAAAYWLSRRAGADVLGLEQFELGHVRGESQDHSRIIRLSYHTPAYVELAKHAYQAWAELERDAGEQLVLKTGGLDFAPRESAIPLTNYSDSMDAAGVAVRAPRRGGDPPALAAVRRHRRHPRAVSARKRHRDGRAGQRGARAHGAGARRDAPRPRAGRAPAIRGRRDRGHRRRRRPTAAGGW